MKFQGHTKDLQHEQRGDGLSELLPDCRVSEVRLHVSITYCMVEPKYLFVSSVAASKLRLRSTGFRSQWLGCGQCLSSTRPFHEAEIRRARIGIEYTPIRDGIVHRRAVTKSTLSTLSSVIDPTVLRSAISAISKLMVTLLLGVAAAKRGLLDSSTLNVRIRS